MVYFSRASYTYGIIDHISQSSITVIYICVQYIIIQYAHAPANSTHPPYFIALVANDFLMYGAMV